MASHPYWSYAVIPARAGSRRVPGKNKRLLMGKPLIAWTIEAALESGVFAKICVSTDDPEIMDIARGYDGVAVNERPAALATSEVQCGEVIRYLLDKESESEADGRITDITQLQATCPLRTGGQIREAMELYRARGADSVVSISEYTFPPQYNMDMDDDGALHPHWTGVNRTDNARKKFHPNGAIIILNAGQYRRTMSYYMERTYGYPMAWESSVDIDEEKDFRIAELVMSGIKNGLLAGRPV